MNKKGGVACSLATLGGDKPLEFFSQKKYYWVRNIAKLGKNSLSHEITWTSCYITRAEPLNIMFVALTRVIYISCELNKLRISKVAHFETQEINIVSGIPRHHLALIPSRSSKEHLWKCGHIIFDCRPLNPFNTVLGSNHMATA